MKKNSVKEQQMFVRVNGVKYAMENTENGNLIARGVGFEAGENNFVFGDSRMTIASRLGYKGDKKVCLIHTFPINNTGTRDLMSVVCYHDALYDVMLIRGKKKNQWKMQIRFSHM